MRMKYEALMCFIYGYERPTGQNGASADVYDSLLNTIVRNEYGEYEFPEEARGELREVAGFLYDAFSFALEKYSDNQEIVKELVRSQYVLDHRPLSIDLINDCIHKVGLILGIFEKLG